MLSAQSWRPCTVLVRARGDSTRTPLANGSSLQPKTARKEQHLIFCGHAAAPCVFGATCTLLFVLFLSCFLFIQITFDIFISDGDSSIIKIACNYFFFDQPICVIGRIVAALTMRSYHNESWEYPSCAFFVFYRSINVVWEM